MIGTIINRPLGSPVTVGVVIPAFNEAQNLSRVLNTVRMVSKISRIIVVDDGSTDATIQIADWHAERDGRVLSISLPENRGKAHAMLEGVQALSTDLVIFLDADLIGLQTFHITKLYTPMIDGSCKMTIAAFTHGGLLTDASHRVFPNFTGQRCLWRVDAEQALIPLANTRYGVEMGLTIHAKDNNWQVEKIIWPGVTHCMKEKKRMVAAGLSSRMQMYRQIIYVLSGNKSGKRLRRRFNFRRARQPLR